MIELAKVINLDDDNDNEDEIAETLLISGKNYLEFVKKNHKTAIHDSNSIIFLYFMTEVLDNFHSSPMVMAPWVD